VNLVGLLQGALERIGREQGRQAGINICINHDVSCLEAGIDCSCASARHCRGHER
jgi:hypothetical protein